MATRKKPEPFHRVRVVDIGHGDLLIDTKAHSSETVSINGIRLSKLEEALNSQAAPEANLAQPTTPVAERQPIYGHPALNFSRQAISWTGKLANKLIHPLTAQDVAIMMADVKLCRLIETPTHEDSIIDVGGYMICLEQVNAAAESGTDGTGIRSETVAQARINRRD